MFAAIFTTSALAGIVVNFQENFESSSNGSTTPPGFFTMETVAGTSAYETTNGNPGNLSGEVTGNHSSNGSQIPAGYITNSNYMGFFVTESITGSFDFKVNSLGSNQNYASSLFILGDIADGISGSNPNEFVAAFLRRQTFGARSSITNGSGGELETNNNNRINDNTWYTATFSWTPNNATAAPYDGDFTYGVNYSTPWTETASFEFDSGLAWIGWGTGGYFSNDFEGTIDNINITATVPEPSSALLAALGSLLVFRRRR